MSLSLIRDVKEGASHVLIDPKKLADAAQFELVGETPDQEVLTQLLVDIPCSPYIYTAQIGSEMTAWVCAPDHFNNGDFPLEPLEGKVNASTLAARIARHRNEGRSIHKPQLGAGIRSGEGWRVFRAEIDGVRFIIVQCCNIDLNPFGFTARDSSGSANASTTD